jgi:hypothetical protein
MALNDAASNPVNRRGPDRNAKFTGDYTEPNLRVKMRREGNGSTTLMNVKEKPDRIFAIRDYNALRVELRVEALDPHDVSAKMGQMYYWVRRLSDSAFILSDQAYTRQPLSECELTQLERLAANQPFPTVLDALHQVLGVSNLGDARSRIRELSLEAIPYMQVIRAVTSMTVYNVIFQEDPFAHDVQTGLIIRILEQDPLYGEFSIIVTSLLSYAEFEF